MTLEEFTKYVMSVSQYAHLFVGDAFNIKAVKSVSLRVDDDGVMSIVMHHDHMPNRQPHENAKEVEQAMRFARQLTKDCPDLKGKLDQFDGFYVHWNVIADSLAEAGDDYLQYDESPLELVTRLINERDDLLEKLKANEETINNAPAS